MELKHEGYKNFKNIKNCIYQFISPSNKSYIGLTKDFYSRYKGHRREGTREDNIKGNKFYCACRKHGFYNFKIFILEQNVEDYEMLKQLEISYIEKFKTTHYSYGYNMTPGGDGATLFGEDNGMYGKKHKSESIQKIKDNMTPQVGELNYWHKSNRTEEELKERGRKAAESYKSNREKLSDEEKEKLHIEKSNKIKNDWKNIENNNLQNSLDALRYWEYKSEEELVEINKKKAQKGIDNGRAKVFVLESPLGETFEVYLDIGLKQFCEEHNLVYRALSCAIDKGYVEYPSKHDTKFYNDEKYKYNRLNTINWKIKVYRRKDYEISNR